MPPLSGRSFGYDAVSYADRDEFVGSGAARNEVCFTVED